MEVELLEAIAAEQEYTGKLLSDPNAQRSRLDRIVHGCTGMEAEYTPQQITQLRSLRGNTEELEGRILSARRDVEQIRRLVAEQQRKEQAQEAINPVLAKFNQACASLAESWAELEAIALQHEIRLDTTDLRAPSGATFQLSGNIVHIVFKK